MTDLELYNLCVEYGRATLEARRKFLGLLPEADRRCLWRQRGFASIFEFAAKLAGVSEEQVRRVLNLDKKFVDKPVLREMLVNGMVSVNKLVRVVSIATVENQEDLALQVKLLSKNALETLVKDEKRTVVPASAGLCSRGEGELEGDIFREATCVVPGHTDLQQILIGAMDGERAMYSLKISGAVNGRLDLTEATVDRLAELQRRGIDVDMLINKALDARELEILEEKLEIAAEEDHKAEVFRGYSERVIGPKPLAGRYIPVKVCRVLEKEFGRKCAVAGCTNMSETRHHTLRFAQGNGHNPFFMAPLCRAHHEIAHAVDARFFRKRQETLLESG